MSYSIRDASSILKRFKLRYLTGEKLDSINALALTPEERDLLALHVRDQFSGTLEFKPATDEAAREGALEGPYTGQEAFLAIKPLGLFHLSGSARMGLCMRERVA